MHSNPLAPSWLEVPTDANALADGVWSVGATRAASGELVVAGVAATTLAREYGTPLYVVDEADARGRAEGVRASFDREFALVGGTARVYYPERRSLRPRSPAG